MRDKKKTEPEKTAERQALEQHVDAMMDPKLPDEVPVESAPPPAAEKPATKAVKTVKITKTAKTAPQLPDKLRKQITVNDTPVAPLSIDKLDELTESIAKSDTPEKSTDEPDEESAETPEPAEPDEPEEADESEAPDEPETPEDDITEQSAELDDVRTDKAVDDIVAHEGDVMLAVADSTAAERNRQVAGTVTQKSGHGVFSTIIWTLVFLMVIVAVAFFAVLFTGGTVPKLPGL